MKEFLLSLIFMVKISKKLRKKIFGEKKKNLLEWLQNLKQHSRPIGTLCGKKFSYKS